MNQLVSFPVLSQIKPQAPLLVAGDIFHLRELTIVGETRKSNCRVVLIEQDRNVSQSLRVWHDRLIPDRRIPGSAHQIEVDDNFSVPCDIGSNCTDCLLSFNKLITFFYFHRPATKRKLIFAFVECW